METVLFGIRVFLNAVYICIAPGSIHEMIMGNPF